MSHIPSNVGAANSLPTWLREATCCFKVGALLQAVFTTWPFRSVLSHLAWDRLVDSPDRLSFLTPGRCVLTRDDGALEWQLPTTYSTTPSSGPSTAPIQPVSKINMPSSAHQHSSSQAQLVAETSPCRDEDCIWKGGGENMSRALVISFRNRN
ncbi:hypothetical protein CGRA01v4_12870 [Colletotrichum graminicola]|nr:hypothetical protein CGRA01v4_12870 [Colletotrichum graminicola]